MDWLLAEAKTAGPFVAAFCLVVLGGTVVVLWRQHLADQRTIASLTASSNRAMLSAARAMTKLATIIEKSRPGR